MRDFHGLAIAGLPAGMGDPAAGGRQNRLTEWAFEIHAAVHRAAAREGVKAIAIAARYHARAGRLAGRDRDQGPLQCIHPLQGEVEPFKRWMQFMVLILEIGNEWTTHRVGGISGQLFRVQTEFANRLFSLFGALNGRQCQAPGKGDLPGLEFGKMSSLRESRADFPRIFGSADSAASGCSPTNCSVI